MNRTVGIAGSGAVVLVAALVLFAPAAASAGAGDRWRIVDEFRPTSQRGAGESLDGRALPNAASGTTWRADAAFRLTGASVRRDAGEGGYAAATVPLLFQPVPGQVHRVGADVVIREPLWVAIGFTSGGDNFFRDGDLWLLVRIGGQLTLQGRGLGDDQAARTRKPEELFNYKGLNRIELIYDQAAKTATVEVNGRVVIDGYDVSTAADDYKMLRGGFATHFGPKGRSARAHEIRRFAVSVADPPESGAD